MKEGLVEVGDVVRSEEFVNAREVRPRSLYDGGEFSVDRHFGDSGYDESRVSARYVVEATAMKGGGTQGMHDHYPNGWNVRARRLGENREYNPNGEVIEFYQSGSFSGLVEKIKVVDKMEIRFVEVGGSK